MAKNNTIIFEFENPDNTRTVERYKPRWTRVCRKCGLEQHTYEQEVVDVKREPKFR